MMAQLGTFKSGEDVSLSFTLNVLDAASATYTLKDGQGEHCCGRCTSGV